MIGPDPAHPPPHEERPFGIDGLDGARLVTFAARVNDIEAAISALRRDGHDPGESFAMQRALPDGGLLSWRLTRPPDWGRGVIPFLIEWGDNPHPSRTCANRARLTDLRARHPDPTRVRAAWSSMGLDYIVAHGLHPCVEATIAGPRGSLTLAG